MSRLVVAVSWLRRDATMLLTSSVFCLSLKNYRALASASTLPSSLLTPVFSSAAVAPKAAIKSVEPAVVEAQGETTKAIGAEKDDGEGPAARPPPKPVLNGDDRYRLESAAKKARKAGNCVPQVS